jgi:hypothetical protein
LYVTSEVSNKPAATVFSYEIKPVFTSGSAFQIILDLHSLQAGLQKMDGCSRAFGVICCGRSSVVWGAEVLGLPLVVILPIDISSITVVLRVGHGHCSFHVHYTDMLRFARVT